MSHPILVTGAAGGQQGSTGRVIAPKFTDAGRVLPSKCQINRRRWSRVH